MSVPARPSFNSFSATSIFSLASGLTLSAWSLRSFSVWKTSESALLRTSASSRRTRSSSAWASASFIMRSISSLLRAVPPVMVICCSRPVPRSLADTCTMPLASMSNEPSTCGTPRDADELERAEQLVAVGHVALALEHLDLHAGLVVVGGGEHLRLLRGDRGVALDELGHDLTLGLDAEGQRRDVEQQDVLDVTLEHAGL